MIDEKTKMQILANLTEASQAAERARASYEKVIESVKKLEEIFADEDDKPIASW